MTNYAAEVKTLEEFALNIPIQKSGVQGEGKYDYHASVTPGPLVSYVADLCEQLLSMRSLSLSFSIEKYFTSLLWYRVSQVQGTNHRDLREVAVPNFFYPVLASLGAYEDPMRALAIRLHMEYDPMTLDEMRKASFEIRACGIAVSLGLPKMLTVTSDELFRISTVGEEFRISGEQVSNSMLMIRTAVNVEFLKEVYAAPRTRYMLVGDAKPAWDSVIVRTFLTEVPVR